MDNTKLIDYTKDSFNSITRLSYTQWRVFRSYRSTDCCQPY